MAVYTVHIPLSASTSFEAQAERVKFVADKFSWPALFFGVFWLVWHRMWWVLAGYIIAFSLLPPAAAFAGVNEIALGWILIATQLLFAIEAASLRRWSLARQGDRMVRVVSGVDREECERKFFANWNPEASWHSDAGLSHSPPENKRPQAGKAETGVIGVFPAPGAHQ